MCHYVNETDRENISFKFLNTYCVEIKFQFEKFESKECIKEVLGMLLQTKFSDERSIYANASGLPTKKSTLFIF